MKIAIYPGTFDPITNGHLDIAVRATELFDLVIIAVSANPGKSPMFTLDERVALIREVVTLGVNNSYTRLVVNNHKIHVCGYTGLTTDLAKRQGAIAMIRGLRAVSDFEYEFQLTHINRHIAPEIETVFLTSKTEHTFISSSMVRELAKFGGDLSPFVHPIVAEALKAKVK